ncbi:hypothetical protein [Paraburkholderia unamae]|uniref:hypothetical protein n=1 Tax=Paraburkholderia unamae TaxID=219649 RepID=UPI003CCC66E6
MKTEPITLYPWNTPNGRKASVALEEMALPYVVQPVNIGNREQFEPSFLSTSPNNPQTSSDGTTPCSIAPAVRLGFEVKLD